MHRTSSVSVLVLLACVLPAFDAAAASYIVDTTSDALLSGCDPGVAQDCSLRGAIAAANAASGGDEIAFDLASSDAGFQPASGHWRIALSSELPLVGESLTIDGFTQAGAAPSGHLPLAPIAHTLKVELRGPNMSNTNCLLASGSLTLRGLVINNCNQAVFLFESGTHVIEGNYIGTDVSGEQAVPNRFGVAMGGNLRIGGTTPAQANLISGNRNGALRQFRQVTRLRVQGNILGPNRLLTAVPALQDYGIQLSGSFADVLIGGSTPAEANTISGNGFNAINITDNAQVAPGAANARVLGNMIGAGIGGLALGNGLNPGSPSQTVPSIQIGLLGYCRVQIGGDGAGEGNLIAYGGNAAVAVSSCWNAALHGNAFYANRGQPIDLATSNSFDGVSPNDPGDADGGNDPMVVQAGNRLQNTAVVEALIEESNADTLRVSLRVDSSPTASSYPLRIDFYRKDSAGILSPARTAWYALADAQRPVEYPLPLAEFTRGIGITVTDAAGNTSEMVFAGPIFADGFEAGVDPGA